MSHPRLVEQTAALCTPPPKAITPSKKGCGACTHPPGPSDSLLRSFSAAC